ASRPTTSACKVVSSDRVTVICSALAMTWLLVTMRPEGSIMNPEPREATRDAGGLGAPGAPFSPKKSRKNSSSGAPGAGGCASGLPLATGDAFTWVVEMLTTPPTSFAASCAKTSAKGVVCGVSARLDAPATRSSVISAARIAPRRPEDLTRYLLQLYAA